MADLQLEVYIENNLEKCQEIWQQIVIDQDLPDNWEYRKTFHLALNRDVYFVVGKIGEQIIGFIPLEFDKDFGEYEYFGAGDWNEGNKFYFLPGYKEKYLPQLLEKLPDKTTLYFLSHQEQDCKFIENDQEQYFVEPAVFDFEIEKFIQNIPGKTGNTVRRQLRQILEKKPTLDNQNQYNYICQANQHRFGDDSIFAEEAYVDIFRDLIENSSFKDKFHFINIYLEEKLVASYLTLLFNNKYYCLVSGYDVEVPNISKYQHYLLFADGFSKKAERIILFVDDCGWKEHWRLSKEMLFKYIKN